MLCFQLALFPSPFSWSGRLLKFPPVPSLLVLLIPALCGDVVLFLPSFFSLSFFLNFFLRSIYLSESPVNLQACVCLVFFLSFCLFLCDKL